MSYFDFGSRLDPIGRLRYDETGKRLYGQKTVRELITNVQRDFELYLQVIDSMVGPRRLERRTSTVSR